MSDPNKRITAQLAREWAAFQAEQRRQRLLRGVKVVLSAAAIAALAIGMMLYLSSRLS